MLAHFEGDEESFRAAAWEVVERERRLSNNVLASKLEQIIHHGAGDPMVKAFVSALNANNGNLPKDLDKDAQLIELSDPERELDSLVVNPDLGVALERIIRERRSGDLLRSHGVSPVSKVLFCGPPGCGKTAAAECLAQALYFPLATVRFDAVVSSYLGQTAANLRRVFDFGRSRPVLLLFDEFDAIGKHRSAADEHGELKRVVNSFLQLLDGFHADTLTVAATNHQGLLDPALWRRFDEIVYFPLPTVEEIQQLIQRQFRQLPLSKSVRVGTIARSLEGFSHADIERMCQEAIKETILEGKEQVTPGVLKSAAERQRGRQALTSKEGSQGC